MIFLNTRRKPSTCYMSLTNFIITFRCIESTSPSVGLELTILMVITTDCIASLKSNYHVFTTVAAILVLQMFHK